MKTFKMLPASLVIFILLILLLSCEKASSETKTTEKESVIAPQKMDSEEISNFVNTINKSLDRQIPRPEDTADKLQANGDYFFKNRENSKTIFGGAIDGQNVAQDFIVSLLGPNVAIVNQDEGVLGWLSLLEWSADKIYSEDVNVWLRPKIDYYSVGNNIVSYRGLGVLENLINTSEGLQYVVVFTEPPIGDGAYRLKTLVHNSSETLNLRYENKRLSIIRDGAISLVIDDFTLKDRSNEELPFEIEIQDVSQKNYVSTDKYFILNFDKNTKFEFPIVFKMLIHRP